MGRERVWEAHGRPSLPSQVYEKRIEGETCEKDGEDDMNSGSERGREEGREGRRGEGGKEDAHIFLSPMVRGRA